MARQWEKQASIAEAVARSRGFPVTRDLLGGRCTTPSDWVIGFTATGTFATGMATYGDGIIPLDAANGDEIWGTYHCGASGPLSATGVWWQDTFVFDGGTGRFASASGRGTDRGTVVIPSLDIPEWNFDGMIAHDHRTAVPARQTL